MANTQCSRHEVAVYLAFLFPPGRTTRQWMSSREVATNALVAYRTARLHTARLVKAGVLQQEKLFPGYRFALAEKPTNVALAYAERLKRAAVIFGLTKEQV